jgi:hypothetical protein
MAKTNNKLKPSAVEPVEPVEQNQIDQIVLTQEQYNTLITIYDTLGEVKDNIEDLVNNDEITQLQLGYQLGCIFSNINSASEELDTLTDVISPFRVNWEGLIENDDEFDVEFSA